MSSVKPISSISVITVISFKYFIDHFSIFYSPNELILNVLIDHHTSYLQCHVGLPTWWPSAVAVWQEDGDISDEQTDGFIDEIWLSWNCLEIGLIAVTSCSCCSSCGILLCSSVCVCWQSVCVSAEEIHSRHWQDSQPVDGVSWFGSKSPWRQSAWRQRMRRRLCGWDWPGSLTII